MPAGAPASGPVTVGGPEGVRAALPEGARNKAQEIAPAPKEQVDLANRIAAEIDSNPNQSPVKTMAEALADLDGKPQNGTEAIKANIGSEISSGGNIDPKSGTPEAARLNRANQADKAVAEVLAGKAITAKDWDRPEFERVRTGLDQFVALTGDPILAQLAADAKAEIYTELVKDPAVLKALIEINGSANEVRIPDINPEILERAQKAAQAYAEKAKEREDTASELTSIEARLSDPKLKAEDDRELKRLEAEQLEAQKRNIQTRIDDALDRRGRINAGKYQGDAEKENLALDGFYQQIDAIDAKIEKRDEIANLPKRADRLRVDKDRLDAEVQDAKDVSDAASTELSLAQGERRDAQEAWVRAKENAVRDAVVKVFDARKAQAEAGSKKVMEEASQREKEEVGQAMARIWERRHWKLDPKTGMPVAIKDSFKADVKRLLQTGPEGVVKQMVENYYEGKFREQYKAQGLSGVDLESAIWRATNQAVSEQMKDKQFVGNWSNKVGPEAFKGAVREGWTPSKDTLNYLDQAPWGQDVLNSLFQNEDVQDLEAKAKAAGIIKENEKLKDKIAKKGILGLILAVAAGTITSSIGVIGLGNGSKH